MHLLPNNVKTSDKMEINSFTFLQLQHSLSSSKCACEITGIGVILYRKRSQKEPIPLVTEKDACLQQKMYYVFDIMKTIQ